MIRDLEYLWKQTALVVPNADAKIMGNLKEDRVVTIERKNVQYVMWFVEHEQWNEMENITPFSSVNYILICFS